MPVKRIWEGCPETRERQIPGRPGADGSKRCGKPIKMNGVCADCYRCNEQLRGEYNPIGANPAASQIDSTGYKRLHIDDDTLRDKGILRDIEMAMIDFDEEWAEFKI